MQLTTDNPSEVFVVGYANQRNVYTQNWKKSLKKVGFTQYRLLGKGEKWNGLATRIRAYQEFLKNQPSNTNILYIFTDVYDLLAVGTPKEFLRKYKRLTIKYQKDELPIIIGAEPNCNSNLCRPLKRYWSTTFEKSKEYNKTKNRYLNFGLLTGSRSALLNLFEWLSQNSKNFHSDIWNEQIATSKYIDQHPEMFILDTRMEFVGNILCHPTCGNQFKFKWEDFLSDGVDPFIGRGRVIYSCQYQYNCPVFIHTPSKGIDACQRYQKYGLLILGKEWQTPGWDMLQIPGYHWILLGILISIFILWVLFGTKEWILAGFFIILIIVILYLLSL